MNWTRIGNMMRLAVSALLVLGVTPSATAQLMPPDWLGLPLLLNTDVTALSDSYSTQEEGGA